MKPGDLVIVDAISLAEYNGKIGFVIDTWTGVVACDEYIDVLIEGIKMSFYRDELRLIEDDKAL